MFLAALEGRVAASYVSTPKPRPQRQRAISFIRQISLTKSKTLIYFLDCFLLSVKNNLEISVEKYLNRSNTPLSFKSKIETAIQIYSTANRSLFNKLEFQLELDVCLRWCSLLWEQNDMKVLSFLWHFI